MLNHIYHFISINLIEWHLVVFAAFVLHEWCKNGVVSIYDACVLFGWELLLFYKLLKRDLRISTRYGKN